MSCKEYVKPSHEDLSQLEVWDFLNKFPEDP